jgi:hypothetical protein
MRKLYVTGTLAAALFVFTVAANAAITGDYLETRNADVYTGMCFANGEVNLVGDQAILAWHVTHGAWNGQKLDDLSVVAAVKANATLGDPYANPYPAHTVMIVDDNATPAQRAALVSFAQHMGGKLLANVERTVAAPIEMQVLHDAAHHGRALVRAGSFAMIQTRGLGENDHFCGNEYTYYPPLTQTSHAMPAVALTDAYNGPGLGVSWTIHDKRSAFVGTFKQ